MEGTALLMSEAEAEAEADLVEMAALARMVMMLGKQLRLAEHPALPLPEILLLLGRQLEVGMAQLRNKYYICDFFPETHTVHVYFTNMPTYRTIEIKLPVVAGMYPEGIDLENYIMSFCPYVT
jgi:hypothetical protein